MAACTHLDIMNIKKEALAMQATAGMYVDARRRSHTGWFIVCFCVLVVIRASKLLVNTMYFTVV
jgi:hypothetical protein